ncbi:MAG: fibronectin type III domain-containing protein, partial [Ferruginibacter sp.]|nr:fibronectin type III domain-containing protein [Cytophagales bacterium]
VRTRTAPPPPDTQAPTAPGALSSPAQTSASVSLTWRAATDNVKVTVYRIYQDGVLIGTTNGTTVSFLATNLTASTGYRFTVTAVDAADNASAASNVLTASTKASLPPPDTQAPLAPAALSSPAQTTSSVSLAWNVATDNVGVTTYRLYRDGVQVGTVNAATTSFLVSGLTAGTSYRFTVVAVDAAGNASAASNELKVNTTSPADTQAPAAPDDLSSPEQTTTSVSLTWGAATDNVGVTTYRIYQDGVLIGTTNGTTVSFLATNLTTNTQYDFTVVAVDAAGNASAASKKLKVNTTSPADTQAPAAPDDLSSSERTTTSVSLTWSAATDNVGVTTYRVYQDGVEVGTVNAPTTSFLVSGLKADTRYDFTVVAVDAAGNASAASKKLKISTQAEAINPASASVPRDSLVLKPHRLFSPNGDGVDDEWKVEGMETCSDCQVMIYTRYGQPVFSAKPYRNDWNAGFQGQPLPQGAYYFVIKRPGFKDVTGSISLIR